METAMTNKARNTSGKFAAKSETPRKIRSVNLTDDAWQWLADVAVQAGISRNDYLEAMAEGSPLMETVEPDSASITEQPGNSVLPIMETVQSELESLKEELEEVKADRVKLLESSARGANKFREEARELRAQLADLKQKSATASQEFPEAADLVNRLRGRLPKSKVTPAEVQTILDILES